MRSAIVVGAGFGGLALAIRLQSAGVQTTVVESRDKPGGRAYYWKLTLARGHFDVEAALKASGLKWTILRPGMFAQNFLQFAESIRQQGKFFASVKQGRIAMIDVRDIAEVAVILAITFAGDLVANRLAFRLGIKDAPR